eukprot:TRINITY_DN3436_c0_g2_i4.p1 TRINITY_DN3436_c0_g2~~TRINITY_DN3436_c0_g2_i4.p1  ORF type:complete len:506 (+),score=138.45 TRINITY_DN3436_c0_g2_i4:424-1941(+)
MTASVLLYRAGTGKMLTRRERRLLNTTLKDLICLIPFSIFIIVPFMEFLLPFALKLFPNLLPSTFISENEKEEKRVKEILAKVEMAKFIQDTATDVEASSEGFEGDFKQFLMEVRSGGILTKEQMLEFIKRFKDDLTLDNLKRSQLHKMCEFMGINSYGPTHLLRYQIDSRINDLKRDDKMIKYETLSRMSLVELKNACVARGIPPIGTRASLETELNEWLHLSIDLEVPNSLLILSRAFRLYVDNSPEIENLARTIKHIPDEIVEDVEFEVARAKAFAKGDRKSQIEILQEERARIAEENREIEERERERTDVVTQAGSVENMDMPELKILEATELLDPAQDLVDIEASVIETVEESEDKPLPRQVLNLSEKLRQICLRIEAEIEESSSLSPESTLTKEQFIDSLKRRGWNELEMKAFTGLLDFSKTGSVSVGDILLMAQQKLQARKFDELKRAEAYEAKVSSGLRETQKGSFKLNNAAGGGGGGSGSGSGSGGGGSGGEKDEK